MKGLPGLLRLRRGALIALFALAWMPVTPAIAARQATAKPAVEPPQCTAIVVPGLPRGHADGRHEAWVYKGRFGRLALDGIFRGGAAADYRFTLGGRALDPLQALGTRAILPCLRAKGVGLPSRIHPRVCSGERFKVIISRPASDRYLLLYMAAGGNSWRFCRASAVPEELVPKPKVTAAPRRAQRP